jgi:hypothetical protein
MTSTEMHMSDKEVLEHYVWLERMGFIDIGLAWDEFVARMTIVHI